MEEYAYCVNKHRQTLVWKHKYDVKLWRHKQRTPNTNIHDMPMNESATRKNSNRGQLPPWTIAT